MVIPMNKHNTLGHQKVGFGKFHILTAGVFEIWRETCKIHFN